MAERSGPVAFYNLAAIPTQRSGPVAFYNLAAIPTQRSGPVAFYDLTSQWVIRGETNPVPNTVVGEEITGPTVSGETFN